MDETETNKPNQKMINVEASTVVEKLSYGLYAIDGKVVPNAREAKKQLEAAMPALFARRERAKAKPATDKRVTVAKKG